MQPHVLVVEDLAILRRLYREFLVVEGYRVTGVPDAETALKSLDADPPDLIVLTSGSRECPAGSSSSASGAPPGGPRHRWWLSPRSASAMTPARPSCLDGTVFLPSRWSRLTSWRKSTSCCPQPRLPESASQPFASPTQRGGWFVPPTCGDSPSLLLEGRPLSPGRAPPFATHSERDSVHVDFLCIYVYYGSKSLFCIWLWMRCVRGPAPGGNRPVRILAVERSDAMRELFRATLARRAMTCASSPKPRMPTGEVDRLHPDLVVLCAQTPHVHAWALLETLRSSPATVKSRSSS